MKFLLLMLALLFSANSEAIDQTPEAEATCGNAYGYEVCVWALNVDGDEYGLRASYRDGDGVWVYLAQRSHFISNMGNKEDTDYYFSTFVEHINNTIDSRLKPISVEPEFGLERLKWLVKNRLSFSNNQLVYSP